MRSEKNCWIRSWRWAVPVVAGLVLAAGCSPHGHGPGAHDSHGEAEGPEPWATTAWGELYEVFPETDPLVAGEVAESHAHVTVLDGFAPLLEGRVAIVLRDSAGSEETFEATVAKRPGIFAIEIRPTREGERDLLFRVEAAAGFEEIPGGRVRVGNAEAPGGLLAAEDDGATFDEISFLTEQPWRTRFATAWSRTGSLAAGIGAPARIVARPGADRLLAAPAAGRVEAEPWPHPGLAVSRGRAIFRVVPSLDEDVSLAEHEAEALALEAELAAAGARSSRLVQLAEEGLVAEQEAELAAAESRALEARLAGARRDVETARRARAGGTGASAESLAIVAPFDGVIAEVEVTPGQTVEGGAPLARFVATDRWWLEAALPPRVASKLAPGPLSLALRMPGLEPVALPAGAARLVALAPAIDDGSGRVKALVELPDELPPGLAGFRVGLSVEVELAAGEPVSGIVAPAETVVDDAGVPVVYVQRSGEGFERREVRVLARQGSEVVIDGVASGERLVVRGGGAVRRSTLAGSGVADGHVH
ncbi:MAG TPA: efflux RND transporter periplasmic adaptor subunit [Thermoanaerobaculia bacterium]|nr:efflux RND transporter periplasmic adaptor subunit [Thermoanaerobaculia bacterium]